ncbi:MAG TPA: carboxypeptidase regulatory-like domain-containing protein [Gemmatimonadales bacterium]|nr:carboxypeptidase regulatory-like domain-containing protein [Gemmatimonadales bacterium]
MALRFHPASVLQASIPLAAFSLWSVAPAPAPLAAQGGRASITGQLINRQSREPVGGARIGLLGVGAESASDSTGRFTHAGLASGTYVLQVRAIGYTATSWIIELGEGEVHSDVYELDPLPVLLDPLRVTQRQSFGEARRAEFERRRAAGRGYFVTEEQIARENPRSLGDLFRHVPGVRMQCRGSMAGCTVRMARAPRECKPDFIVDGFEASNSTSLDMPTIGIIGIEIYRTLSETPVQFLRTDNQCGTIVIWTQSGLH